MAIALKLQEDYSGAALRRLAARTKNVNQSRRLLSLAAVQDGMNRTKAARIGGMARQTLRDWVHRFNAHGPDGRKDTWSKGNPPRLSADQQHELAALVEAGRSRSGPRPAQQDGVNGGRLIGPSMASCAGGGSTCNA